MLLVIIVIYLQMKKEKQQSFMTGEKSAVYVDVCVNTLSTSTLLS